MGRTLRRRRPMVPALLTVAATLVAVASASTCKTVSTEPNFNITAFTTGRWYTHEMMVIGYLPPKDFYCVYAEYSLDEAHLTAKVHNYLNKGKVNGPAEGPTTFICAFVPNATVTSKLEVGPCVLPHFTYGPYWVVAAGSSKPNATDNYEWALISGGQPTIDTGSGCKTGDGVNGAGLWVFTRDSVRNNATVSAVREIAKAKGFDVSV